MKQSTERVLTNVAGEEVHVRVMIDVGEALEKHIVHLANKARRGNGKATSSGGVVSVEILPGP